MSDQRLLRAHRSRPHAVDALRAEESELVLREAVQARAGGVIHFETDALELRQIERPGQRAAEVGEALLVRVVLREHAPRLPAGAAVVLVPPCRRGAPARVLPF